jgi:D-alanyl-D-alanine carboxypeptidase/D-alanyl-D-alanine-endopeptidase (penicillin-binding protein 4)
MPKKIFTFHKGFFCVFSIILICRSESLANSLEQLKTQLKKAVDSSSLKKEELSLYMTTLEGDQPVVLMDLQGHKKMIPASISKIVTTSGVLQHLKPGTKFKTQLFLQDMPSRKNSTVKGHLYLKGGGDPSFVSENMWFLVNHLTRTGVKKIEGDIIVDDSLFDKVRYDESREDRRVDRAYDAPVGAMSFNWNSINIFVRPTQNGQAAEVFLDPENGYTQLVNRTKTKSGSSADLMADREGRKIIVSGSIGVGSKENIIYKNIQEPDLWAGENLKSFLAQRGITVKGTVKNGKVPADAEVVAESESKGIEQVVADMNKFSNNYVAEMLCKNISVALGQEGSLKNCVKSLNDHARELGVPKEEFEFYNPSGLTRDNKMSSFAMWKFLEHLHQDFRLFPEVVISLPISGVDGTLKRRMKNTPAEGWVRAKTGYLNNVISLAGYAGRHDGRVFTFSFIYNGPTDEAKVRNLFDQWLVLLVK